MWFRDFKNLLHFKTTKVVKFQKTQTYHVKSTIKCIVHNSVLICIVIIFRKHSYIILYKFWLWAKNHIFTHLPCLQGALRRGELQAKADELQRRRKRDQLTHTEESHFFKKTNTKTCWWRFYKFHLYAFCLINCMFHKSPTEVNLKKSLATFLQTCCWRLDVLVYIKITQVPKKLETAWCSVRNLLFYPCALRRLQTASERPLRITEVGIKKHQGRFQWRNHLVLVGVNHWIDQF